MIFATDTNRYSDLVASDPRAIEIFQSATEIYLPFIVVGELRRGFLHGSRAVENERLLAATLNSARVHLMFPDELTTRTFAEVSVKLRRQGTPIPDHDVWISAMCIQHAIPLFSRDVHFDYVPNLLRVH